ncbi:hypothetical protein Val02_24650 [Virgisporangium aliadipatigenens]|uniref:ABC transporter domain-containing protein n=1 Tax=Virgisporangium aliadipatigenens TaxID=741659 RepID=A0A8J4DPK0_9ACTN|nr:hypothetical protein Val02_24650 [Virgisporangium aliadipatigenens]
MSAVDMRNVSRVYPGGVTALADATLTVEDGELVAVVGPSGSGKSTLLHLAGTLDRPTSGTVHVAGQDVGRLSDRALSQLRARSIGFVFQQFHLGVGVTALDAVADGLLYAGVPRRRRRDAAAEALERVGLAHRLTHRPHQLSGGERQRVAVARAIVGSPRLLLADEPTGNLDSSSGADVVELLTGLHRAGTAVVVITHDRDLARSFPRVVSVRDGRVSTTRPDGSFAAESALSDGEPPSGGWVPASPDSRPAPDGNIPASGHGRAAPGGHVLAAPEGRVPPDGHPPSGGRSAAEAAR